MKKFIALAGALTLAACGGGTDEAADAEATDDGAGAVLDDMPVSDGPAGTYEVTMEDGTVGMSVLSEDGTYVDSVNGEMTESGTWTAEGQQMCFDPEGDEPETCVTNGEPDADGVFQSTMEDGTSTTVRKVM